MAFLFNLCAEFFCNGRHNWFQNVCRIVSLIIHVRVLHLKGNHLFAQKKMKFWNGIYEDQTRIWQEQSASRTPYRSIVVWRLMCQYNNCHCWQVKLYNSFNAEFFLINWTSVKTAPVGPYVCTVHYFKQHSSQNNPRVACCWVRVWSTGKRFLEAHFKN